MKKTELKSNHLRVLSLLEQKSELKKEREVIANKVILENFSLASVEELSSFDNKINAVIEELKSL